MGGGDIWGQLSGQHAAADNTRLQTLLLKFIATGSVGGGGGEGQKIEDGVLRMTKSIG